jgi:hypothetical protein
MTTVRGFSGIGAGLLAFAMLAACEMNPTGPLPPSLLEARIEGSVASDYQGNGVFSTLQRGPIGFILNSAGNGAARNEGFQFMSAAMPGEGAHTLGGADAQVRARYTIREGNVLKLYDARSGELVVTAASQDRFEGTFHFTGRLGAECDVSQPGFMSCAIVPEDENLPAIAVSGSIEAVAARVAGSATTDSARSVP